MHVRIHSEALSECECIWSVNNKTTRAHSCKCVVIEQRRKPMPKRRRRQIHFRYGLHFSESSELTLRLNFFFLFIEFRATNETQQIYRLNMHVGTHNCNAFYALELAFDANSFWHSDAADLECWHFQLLFPDFHSMLSSVFQRSSNYFWPFSETFHILRVFKSKMGSASTFNDSAVCPIHLKWKVYFLFALLTIIFGSSGISSNSIALVFSNSFTNTRQNNWTSNMNL